MGILKKLLGVSDEKVSTVTLPDLDTGVHLIDQGRYEEACEHLHALTASQPDSTAALYNYGAALALSGREKHALSAFDKAILIDQTCWPALINAASIRIKTGEHLHAINDFRNAASFRDMADDAILVFARCLLIDGQFSEAIALLKLNVHRLYTTAPFWLYFGIACQFSGLTLESIAALKKSAALNPDSDAESSRVGLLMTENGRFGEARTVLSQLIRTDIGNDQNLISFARLQEVLGNQKTARRTYEIILDRSSDNTEALTNLGNILKQNGDYAQAEFAYRKGLSLTPGSAILHKNLSNLLGTTLRSKEAIEELTQCVSLAPQNPYHFSDLLFAQQYSSTLSVNDHKNAAQEWGRRFCRPNNIADVKARPSEHRPLRIGLISGSFRQHPVGFLALPGLEALDPSKFSIYCYANQVDCDAYTLRFRAMSERWRPVAHLPDQRLEQMVIEDGIDILIEMAGHAAGHRLPIVARRLAPVQVKWVGGQFNTMGINSMDYFLSDPIETPAESDKAFIENVFRLPKVYACYEPPKNAPDVSSLPAITSDYITFGSLNKANKLTPETIALWSKCLTAVPNSKLLLKGDSFGHQPTCDYARTLFSKHGIDGTRIEMHGFTPHPHLLSTYNDIDIALDPIPYSGCLTTCEAMWMGVPVLTLPGATFAGRHSASFLNAVGLNEWIARDEEHYVELLKERCNDLQSLDKFRKSLRQRMANSALCDVERFGADLGIALQTMWRKKSAPLENEAA